MRLHAIEAHNFMSLYDFLIDRLDSPLNFIIGPNGAGKTTVFRAVRALRDAFHDFSVGGVKDLSIFSTQGRAGTPPEVIDLTLKVEFNTLWEQKLITAFLCASLFNQDQANYLQQAKSVPKITNKGIALFSGWLLNELCPDCVPFLFAGDLRITYRREAYPYLRLSYTFTCADTPIHILAGTAGFGDGFFCKGTLPDRRIGGGNIEPKVLEYFAQSAPPMGTQFVNDMLQRYS